MLVQNPSLSSSVFARKVDNLNEIVSLELFILKNDFLFYECKLIISPEGGVCIISPSHAIFNLKLVK